MYQFHHLPMVKAGIQYQLWIISIAFWTSIMWPGSVHDAHVVAHSTFYKRANVG